MKPNPAIVPWSGPRGWRGEALPDFEAFAFAEIPWVPIRQEGRAVDGIECVKASNSRRVLRIASPSGADQSQPVLYLKRYLANTWRRRMGLRLIGVRAAREFHLGQALLAAGVSTPRPLAWAAHPSAYHLEYKGKSFAIPPASYLLTLEWPNQGSVRDWLVGHPQREKTFIDGLARFLAEAHQLGFYHDDCTAEHVLVAPEADQPDPVTPSKFALIDVDNGSMSGKPLPRRLRIANLFQMLRSIPIELLSTPERVEFVKAYLESPGVSGLPAVDACIVAIERLARRKVSRSVMHA